MEAVQAVGTLIKGAGAMEAGKYNRDVAYAQAKDELIVGNAEELRVRDAARMQMGLQVASQAESGFAPGTGSSLRMLEESAINAELDRLNIRRAAQGRAAGLRSQGKMAKKEGELAMTAAYWQAGSDIAVAQQVRSDQRRAGGVDFGPGRGGTPANSASGAIRSSRSNYGG